MIFFMYICFIILKFEVNASAGGLLITYIASHATLSAELLLFIRDNYVHMPHAHVMLNGFFRTIELYDKKKLFTYIQNSLSLQPHTLLSYTAVSRRPSMEMCCGI